MGVDGYLVEVEVDMFNALPRLDMVGLPDTAVQESRERVRSAIKNSDYYFPIKKITFKPEIWYFNHNSIYFYIVTG